LNSLIFRTTLARGPQFIPFHADPGPLEAAYATRMRSF